MTEPIWNDIGCAFCGKYIGKYNMIGHMPHLVIKCKDCQGKLYQWRVNK